MSEIRSAYQPIRYSWISGICSVPPIGSGQEQMIFQLNAYGQNFNCITWGLEPGSPHFGQTHFPQFHFLSSFWSPTVCGAATRPLHWLCRQNITLPFLSRKDTSHTLLPTPRGIQLRRAASCRTRRKSFRRPRPLRTYPRETEPKTRSTISIPTQRPSTQTRTAGTLASLLPKDGGQQAGGFGIALAQ